MPFRPQMHADLFEPQMHTDSHRFRLSILGACNKTLTGTNRSSSSPHRMVRFEPVLGGLPNTGRRVVTQESCGDYSRQLSGGSLDRMVLECIGCRVGMRERVHSYLSACVGSMCVARSRQARA